MGTEELQLPKAFQRKQHYQDTFAFIVAALLPWNDTDLGLLLALVQSRNTQGAITRIRIQTQIHSCTKKISSANHIAAPNSHNRLLP